MLKFSDLAVGDRFHFAEYFAGEFRPRVSRVWVKLSVRKYRIVEQPDGPRERATECVLTVGSGDARVWKAR